MATYKSFEISSGILTIQNAEDFLKSKQKEIEILHNDLIFLIETKIQTYQSERERGEVKKNLKRDIKRLHKVNNEYNQLRMDVEEEISESNNKDDITMYLSAFMATLNTITFILDPIKSKKRKGVQRFTHDKDYIRQETKRESKLKRKLKDITNVLVYGNAQDIQQLRDSLR